jgi:hypothetical protein
LRSDSGDEEARSFELPDGKIIQVHTKFYNRSLASFEKSRSKVLAQRGVEQSEVFFFYMGFKTYLCHFPGSSSKSQPQLDMFQVSEKIRSSATEILFGGVEGERGTSEVDHR